MTSPQIATDFIHTSVEPEPGGPIDQVSLSDRARLGVVLQSAALLSHLEAAGWRLKTSWREMNLDQVGLLRGAHCEPGADPVPAQARVISLVGELFGSEDRVTGKGQAKRVVSRFLRRWHRCPNKLPADRIVTELLDEAGFLWEQMFSEARRALVAEITFGETCRCIIAGRGAFERRLLARGDSRAALEGLVCQVDSGRDWLRCRDGKRCVDSVESRLDNGRWLHSRGRWVESLDKLANLRDPSAQIVRADCFRLLGKRVAARKLLESLGRQKKLSTNQRLHHTDVSISLYLDLSKPQLAWSLLEQRELETPRRCAESLDFLAAELSGRLGDWQAASRRLVSLDGLSKDPGLSWRWYRLQLWWALERGEMEEAESYAGQALTRGRRVMPRHASGGLWRDIASARRRKGDLEGAEKAAVHALQILESINEREATETSRWIADLKIRRGHLQYARTVLRSNDVEPTTRDDPTTPGPLVLGMRMDLALGWPARAVRRVESRVADIGSRHTAGRDYLLVLTARALGWMGRGAEARELLDKVPDSRFGYLEPEEVPAMWALAGDWSKAVELAGTDAIGQLWRRVLRREPVPTPDWMLLRSLGKLRAARLVFDFQVLAPGLVPRDWLDRAAHDLRQLGAHPFAERLDRTRSGSWRALESFLQDSSQRAPDFGDLFAAAGYFDARLEWRYQGSNQVLISGRGGSEELTAEKGGGRLVLSAESMDPVVKVLFALTVRDFEPGGAVVDLAPSRVRGILGESELLRRALVRLERLARCEVTVLIQGETGTGKELAARQIHRLSSRSSGPLVTVNCAALSETLLLSDLFGHVRGAFTGADRDRAGIFESARGGTVLLDEIGDLPLSAQGKLLRVLQEGEVRRVGESLPRRIDIRVVGATHRDLRSMVDQRTFRSDLFYRLKVGSLTLPPLRDRERDVLLLADHFVERSGRRLTPRARTRLLSHHWPGNVRELQNVLELAEAMSEGAVIDLPALELPEGEAKDPRGYHRQVEEFRRDLVRTALAASDGRRSVAARRLEVSRQALSYLVRRFGLQ